MPLGKNSCPVYDTDKSAAACSRVPTSHLALGCGMDPRGMVLTHLVPSACPPHHPNTHFSWGFCPFLLLGCPSEVPKTLPFLLCPAGNLISPVNDTQSYFGAGLPRGREARQRFDWRRTTQRRVGGGVAQPNPGQQSHCQGTWGDLLLHVPAIAGVSVLFSWRGKGGGTPSQHGLPMSSVPLFPLPPPFISVGIGSFFLCPELCPPQTQTRLQVRPKAAALRRGGFGDADVQQKVEKLREG